MCNMVMEVLFDRRIGLFVMTFQGQEIITALVPNLARNRRLTAHGIHRHTTPFDGSSLQEFRHGGDLIGRALRLALTHNEAAVLCTPRRVHVQGEEAVAQSNDAGTVLPSREMRAPWVSGATACVQAKKHS